MIVTVGAVVLLVAGCSTSGKKTLTSGDLSKAMPTAQDIGADFHRDRAGERDTNANTKLQVPKSCRALLNSDDDKGKAKAKRNFKDSKEREIDVNASVTKVTLEALESAAKRCKEVPFSDGSTKGTIAFTLKPSTGVGDKADALKLVLHQRARHLRQAGRRRDLRRRSRRDRRSGQDHAHRPRDGRQGRTCARSEDQGRTGLSLDRLACVPQRASSCLI